MLTCSNLGDVWGWCYWVYRPVERRLGDFIWLIFLFRWFKTLWLISLYYWSMELLSNHCSYVSADFFGKKSWESWTNLSLQTDATSVIQFGLRIGAVSLLLYHDIMFVRYLPGTIFVILLISFFVSISRWRWTCGLYCCCFKRLLYFLEIFLKELIGGLVLFDIMTLNGFFYYMY